MCSTALNKSVPSGKRNEFVGDLEVLLLLESKHGVGRIAMVLDHDRKALIGLVAGLRYKRNVAQKRDI